MKYIYTIFIVLLISLSLFSNTYSSTNSLFNNTTSKVPYCDNNECGLDKGIEAIKAVDVIETDVKASDYIQGIVKYILGFLSIIAIIIIIYAGFNILTGAGDEEKVKKSKSMILYTIIGLIIIFLAGPIIKFILLGLES